MLCSTTCDVSGDNENHIVSINEVFNKHCNQLDGEVCKRWLVRKIDLATCAMIYVASVSLQSRRVLKHEEVIKKKRIMKCRNLIVTREFIAEWLQLGLDRSDPNGKQKILKQLTDKCQEEFKANNDGEKKCQ